MTGSAGAREALDAARALLADAARVVVLTGAGMSAESGVPTFRGPEGLWKTYRPEDLATPEAFARDPRLVWEWYGWRRGLVAACRPNAGHRALARFALDGGGTVNLVTQNVDGLHEVAAREAAGESDVAPALPLNLHGSLMGDRCPSCGIRTAGSTAVDATSVDSLPRCRRCGSLLRPDVVWFGEALDERVIHRAFAVAAEADACLVVGTSGVVHPAASVPLATVRAGGRVVEVNPRETALTSVSALSLRGAAAELLPSLLATPPFPADSV